jgi:hypothetical protein
MPIPIHDLYSTGQISGWDEPEAKEFFKTVGYKLPKFKLLNQVQDYKNGRRMLWEYTRAVLGKDTPNYAQEIGDCVSFGGKNTLEHLQCAEIKLDGDAEKFRYIFPPYFYGTSRVQVGGGRLGGDGSTGAWLQKAVQDYGVLATDDEGVPKYSGSVAKVWGRSGPPSNFIQIAKSHLIKTVTYVDNVEDLANFINAGYPCPVCSNQGFSMTPDSQGFHRPQGSWAHCMCIIGFEDHPQFGLYFIILNSWGDQHGRLKDFKTGVDMPAGILRVKADVVNRMLQQRDSWVYSMFDGYPDNSDKLDLIDFDLVGKR